MLVGKIACVNILSHCRLSSPFAAKEIASASLDQTHHEDLILSRSYRVGYRFNSLLPGSKSEKGNRISFRFQSIEN